MNNEILTVFCVCVGDKYDSEYVYKLQAAVEKYLTLDHEFVCITTRKLPGVITRNPPVPYPGWWAKIGLFYPGVAYGPSIYFDLDVTIENNIDYLAAHTGTFSAVQNWPQSGHGGLQSSVMAWPGQWYLPFEKIQWPDVSTHFHGDQEYIFSLIGEDYQRIPGVCSYKYHCQKGKPASASIVVYHGSPKPHELGDLWKSYSTAICR